VVTSLAGQATVVHVSTPQPIPLKFKDDVFLGDKIATAEDSIVKFLMGGKALVTVRELSVFTITEEAGRSKVTIDRGKLGLSVARSKMRPGEIIEIHTPNAIAAVRGTVIIVEVVTVGAVTTTNFHVLTGSLDVGGLGVPTAPVTVGKYQSVAVTGSQVGSVQSVSPQTATQLFKNFLSAPPQHKNLPEEAQTHVILKEAAKGTALAMILAPDQTSGQGQAGGQPPDPVLKEASTSPGGPGAGSEGALVNAITTSDPTNGTDNLAKVVSTTQLSETTLTTIAAGAPPDSPLAPFNPSPPPPPPDVLISGQTITLGPGDTVKTFGSDQTRTGTSPVAQVGTSTVTQSPVGNLFQVNQGATVNLSGPLADVTNSTLSAGTNVLAIQGALKDSASSPLINADPTTISAPGDYIQVEGGSLKVSGPLLSTVGGTVTVGTSTAGGSLLSVSSGGIVTSSTTSALFQLGDGSPNGGTTTSVGQLPSGQTPGSPGHLLSLDDSSLTLAGPLVQATGGSLTVSDAAVEMTNPTAPLNFGSNAIIVVRAGHDGGHTLTTNGPLVQITGGTLMADALVKSDGAGNTLNLNGGFLNATNSTVTLRTILNLPAGGTDTVTFGNPAVQLSTSTLTLTGDGTNPGNFQVGTGSSLVLSGGTQTLPGTVSTTGAVTVNSAATMGSLEQTGGVLNGTGGLTVTGVLHWTGGTQNGTGTTVASGGVTMSGGTDKTLSRTLQLGAVSSLSATLSTVGLVIDSAGTLDLNGQPFSVTSGTLTLTGTGSRLIGTGSSQLSVAATAIVAANTAGTATITPTLSNAGLVDVQAGTLVLSGSVTNSGTFTAEAGTTLTVSGALTNYSSGTSTLTGGTYTVLGTMRIAGANIGTNAATIILDGASSQLLNDTTSTNALANFATNAATGNFTIKNGRNFSQAGAFQNEGAITIGTAVADPSTLTLSGGSGGTGHDGSFSGTGTLSLAGSHTFNSGSSITVAHVIFAGAGGDVFNIGGIYNLSGSSTTVHGGTINFTNPSDKTIGTLTIDGGTANFSGTPGGPFAVSATTAGLSGTGTLTGSDTLTASGALTWSGGTMAGTGTTVAQGGLALTGDVTLNRTLNISGMSTIQGDFTINGTGTLANAGTLTKTTGNGIATINPIFNNTGTLNIVSGTLQLAGTGTSTGGAFTVPSPSTLEFTNDYTLDNSSSLTGTGTVKFSGGTVTSNGTYNVGATEIAGGTAIINGSHTGTLTLSSGILDGSGTLTVTGLTTWSGGTMQGSGTTQANGGLTLVGGTLTLDGTRTLNNAGTGTWTSGSLNLLGSGTIFANQFGATLTDNTTALSSIFGSGTFNNAGTFTKTGGTITRLDSTFNNSGAVDLQNGTLEVRGSGTHSGSFAVASPATLQFGSNATGGTHTLTGDVTGAGSVRVNTGNVTMNGGTYNITGVTDLNGNGNFTINSGSTVAAVGAVSISGGELRFDSGDLIQPTSVTLTGGTLRGTDNITVQSGGLTTFSGGTMNGASTFTTSDVGITLSGGTKDLINSRVLVIAGPATWSSGNIELFSGSQLQIQSGITLTDTGTGALALSGNLFTNAGSYVKTGAGTTTISADFTNQATGLVDVQAGTLVLSGTVTNTGTFKSVSTDTLTVSGTLTNYNSVTNTLTGGTYNVLGTMRLVGVNIVTNAATIILDGAGSNLYSTAFPTNTNALAGFATNSGNFTIQNGRDFTTPGALSNSGAITVGNASTLSLGGDITGGGGSLTINNGGTLLQSQGTQNTVSSALANQGSVVVQTGWLLFTGGTACSGPCSGSFDVNAGQLLDLRGVSKTYDLGGPISGAGTFYVEDSGAVVNVTGPYTVSGTTTVSNNGTLNLSTGSALSLGTLQVTAPNGTLTGTDNITVTNGFTWSGIITATSGSPKVTVASGATGTIVGNVTLSGNRTLEIAGSINWTVNNITIGAGSEFKILAGGTLTSAGGSTLGGGTGVISNAGTFLKTGATQSDTGSPFTNTGLVEVQGGTLLLGSLVTNNGTLRVTGSVAGDAMRVSNLTNYSGGTLTGGTYEVIAPVGTTAMMRLLSANIVTNAATILLDGVGSNLYSVDSPGTTDALAGFTTNAAAGSFTIQNGANFTTAGTLTNAGNVTVGASTTLTIGGSGNYVQTAGLTTINGAITLPGGGGYVVSGGTVTAPNGLATLGADLTLNGSFISQSGGLVTAGANLLTVNSSTLTSGTAAVFDLTGGTLQTTGAGNRLMLLDGGTLNLGGSFLNESGGSTVNLAFSVLRAQAGATITGTSAPFVQVTGSSLSSGGVLVGVNGPVTKLTLGGPLLSAASGSTVVFSSDNMVSALAGGTITGHGLTPFIQVDGSGTTLSTPTFDLVFVSGTGSTMSLARALLSVTGGGAVTVGNGSNLFGVLDAQNGAMITGGGMDAFIQVAGSGSSLSTTFSAVFLSGGGTSLDLHGPLLSATSGSTVTFGADALEVFGGAALTGHGSAPLIQVDGSGTSLKTTFDTVFVSDTGTTISLAGALLSVTGGGAVTIGDAHHTNGVLTAEAGATVTGSGTDPFVQVAGMNSALSTTGTALFLNGSGTSLTLSGSFASVAGMSTLNVGVFQGLAAVTASAQFALGGALLSATGGATVSGRAILDVESGAAVTGTGLGAFIQADGPGTTLNTSGFFVFLSGTGTPASATLTLAGPLLSVTNGGMVTVSGNVVEIDAGAVVTGQGTAPFIQTSGSNLSTPSLFDVVFLTGSGSKLDLQGPLLSVTSGGTVTTGDALTAVLGSSVIGHGTAPFIQVDGSGTTLSTTFDTVFVSDTGTTMSLAGALLSVTGGGAVTVGDVNHASALLTAEAGATITGSGAAPFIQVSGIGSSLNAKGSAAFLSDGGTTLALAGPLLSVTGGGSVNVGSVLDVENGATVTGTGTGAFLQVDGGGYSCNNACVFVSGSGTTLTLAGPLTSSTNGDPVVSDFLDVEAGAAVTGTGPGAFFRVDSGTFLNGGNNLVFVAGTGAPATATLNLAGPLLSATTGASVTANNNLLDVESGGAVTGTGSGAFIQVDGSSTMLSTGNDLVFVAGTGAPATATLALAGPLLSFTNGASVNVGGSLLEMDTGAVVTGHSTAPFIQVSDSNLSLGLEALFISFSGTTLTLSGPFASVMGTSILDVGGSLAIVTNSAQLTLGGVLLSMSNGTPTVTIAGDLLSVWSGSTVNGPTDGTPLISIASSSSTGLSVAGALVYLADSSAVLNLTGPILRMTGGVAQAGFGLLMVAGASLAPTDPTPTQTTTVSVGTNPQGIAFTPDGSRAYVANSGGSSTTVSVVDTATNTVSSTITVGSRPTDVVVTPDGTKAYVTNLSSNSVSVINTSNNSVGTPVPVGSSPVAAAVSPDGTKVYVSNAGGNTISVINTSNNSVSTTIGVGTSPFGIAFSPDGGRAYVANDGTNTVSVIDTGANSVVATIIVGNAPAEVAVTPDGTRAYVSNGSSNTVSVIDTATNIVVATIGVGNTPRGIRVTPDGTRVYVTNVDSNNVSIINTANNSVIATVGTGTGPNLLAISPDGSRAYVTNITSNTVSVINGVTAPLFQVAGGSLTLGNLVSIPATASLTLAHPLLDVINTGSVTSNADMVSVSGTLIVNDLAPLIKVGGSANLTTTGSSNLVSVGAGGVLTLGGDLLQKSGTGMVTLGGSLLDPISGATINISGNVLDLVGGTVAGSTTGAPLVNFGAGTLTVTGNLVNVTGSTAFLNLTGPMLQVNGGANVSVGNAADFALFNSILSVVNGAAVTGTGTGAFIQADGSGTILSANINNANNLVFMFGTGAPASATLTLAGPLLSVTGGASVNVYRLLDAEYGAAVTGTGTGAFIQVGGSGTMLNTSINGDDLVIVTSSATLTLAGPLLSVTGGASMNIGNNLLDGGATASSVVTGTGLGAFIQVSGSQVTVLDELVTPNTLNLAGPLLSVTGGGGVNVGFILLDLSGPVTGTGTPSFIQVDGNSSTLSTGDDLVYVSGTGIQLNLSGPLLSVKNGGSVSVGSILLDVEDSGSVTGTGTGALIQVDGTGTTLSVPNNNLVSVLGADTPADTTLTLAGPLLSVKNGGSVSVGGVGSHLLDVESGGAVRGTGSMPFIQADGASTLLSTPNSYTVLITDAGSMLALSGPLLTVTNGGHVFDGNILSVQNGGVVTSTGTGAFIQVTGSTINGPNYDFVFLSGTGTPASAMLSLAGPLLSVTSGASMTAGNFLFDAVSGAVVTGTSSDAFIQVDISTLSVPNNNLVSVLGTGTTASTTLTLAGPLLSVTNGASVSVGSILLDVESGGSVTGTGTDAFIQVDGSTTTLTVGAGSNLVLVSNSTVMLTGGSLLGVTGGSALTFGADVVSLNTGLAVLNTAATIPPSMVVDGSGSSVTVTSGSLFAVAGGGILAGRADLLQLTNFGTATLTRGALVSLSGNGAFALTGSGSLVDYGYTDGGTLTISGPPPSCTSCSVDNSLGFPVLLQSAFISQVHVKSGFTAYSGTGTSNINPSAGLLMLDGTSSIVFLGSFVTGDIAGDILIPSLSYTNPYVVPPGQNLKEFVAANNNVFATESIVGNMHVVTSPLIFIDNSTVTMNNSGGYLSLILVDTGANVILNGTLLYVTDGSTVTANLHVVEIAGTLRGIGPDPLVLVDENGTTLNAPKGDLLSMQQAGSQLVLAGPLLSVTNGASVSVGNNVLHLESGAAVTGIGTGAFIQVDNSHSTILNAPYPGSGNTDLVFMNGNATLTLAGPLLSVANGASVSLGNNILDAEQGAVVTGTGTMPFLQVAGPTVVDGTMLSLSDGLVYVTDTGTTLTLAGPLLSVTGGANVTIGLSLLDVENGAAVTGTGTMPFLQVDGPKTTVITSDSLIYVAGTGTPASTTFYLAGPLLSVTGGGHSEYRLRPPRREQRCGRDEHRGGDIRPGKRN
jgi:YVTN family beta-propeller protein